jgi:hypothetical protein
VSTSPTDTDGSIVEDGVRGVEDSTPQPFRFLALPPEQRNQIYKYCLVPGKKLGLAAVGCDDPDRREKVCHVEFGLWCMMHYDNSCAFNPHILRTCRAVHNEATSILYGSNNFHLGPGYLSLVGNPENLLSYPNGPIKYLRQLEIGRHTGHDGGMGVALDSLKNAVSLERIVVDFTWIHCFKSPETMAKAIMTLKRQLNCTKRANGRKEVSIQFFSIKERARTKKRFGRDNEHYKLAPGGSKDAAIFLPAFKKALKTMVKAEKTKLAKEQTKKSAQQAKKAAKTAKKTTERSRKAAERSAKSATKAKKARTRASEA